MKAQKQTPVLTHEEIKKLQQDKKNKILTGQIITKNGKDRNTRPEGKGTV